MKMRIQVVIEHDGGEPEIEELVCLSRDTDHLSIERLGLSLDEAKDLLAKTQTTLIARQAEAFTERHGCCQECGAIFQKNGTHQTTVRTLFGSVKLVSQRFYICRCQSQEEPGQKKNRSSFSPLAEVLPERTTPEFRYLQAKWSSLMSYGLTSQLLEEVLPLSKRISTATLSRCVKLVTQRADSELGEEQGAFIEGCQRDWEDLPLPGAPLVVGIDGGYVHRREGADRKAGFFEVIVGKGMAENAPTRRFGFVNTYDSKPKRRLYEMLMAQGMQMNQRVTFLSDGGDTVRDLQLYLSPESEHLLDWKGGCSCARSSLGRNILPLEISFYLLPEEALGKGGNKANLDEQPQDRFSHGQTRIGIAQRDRLSKKASTMKAAETQHQRFIPAQMRRGEMAGQQIEAHKAKDHEQIRQETALRSVSVACH